VHSGDERFEAACVLRHRGMMYVSQRQRETTSVTSNSRASPSAEQTCNDNDCPDEQMKSPGHIKGEIVMTLIKET
jgi:hypothetical protein